MSLIRFTPLAPSGGACGAGRRETAALLRAMISSISFPFSRARGNERGIARGVSSGMSGIGETRCLKRSIPALPDDVRRYSHPAASPPRCARYATPPCDSAIPPTRFITTSSATIHFTLSGSTPNRYTSSSGQRVA